MKEIFAYSFTLFLVSTFVYGSEINSQTSSEKIQLYAVILSQEDKYQVPVQWIWIKTKNPKPPKEFEFMPYHFRASDDFIEIPD